VHPRNILRSCNFVLSRNVVVRAPQSPRNYEHTGPFVDVDALLIAEMTVPIARIGHTAIYRPRQVAAA